MNLDHTFSWRSVAAGKPVSVVVTTAAIERTAGTVVTVTVGVRKAIPAAAIAVVVVVVVVAAAAAVVAAVE